MNRLHNLFEKLKLVVAHKSASEQKSNSLKFVAIGDSITEKNFTASKNWVDIIVEEFGYNCVNLGKSGYGYNGVDGRFSENYSSVPHDADVVVFYGSFNDRDGRVGCETDKYIEGENNSLAAYMNYGYDYIKRNCPQAKLAVISPAPWSFLNPSDVNSNASEYVAVMKRICASKNIPFLDLYHNSCMTPWIDEYNKKYYYNADGKHPNNAGHRILASKIIPFLQDIMK